MEYREIVAVTGLSGLYQLLTTKSDGAIVRNIADKSTKFISARQHNVTPLDSIEVYTMGENVRLHEVFQKIQESEGTTPPLTAGNVSASDIKQYFKTIFPEFDEDRVYVSDMKKMMKWYELLKANDLLNFDEATEDAVPAEADATENQAEETAATTPEAEAPVSPKKTAKKAAKKTEE